MSSVKFLAEVSKRAEHLDKAIMFAVTKDGTMVLMQQRGVTQAVLKKARAMIGQAISDAKAEAKP